MVTQLCSLLGLLAQKADPASVREVTLVVKEPKTGRERDWRETGSPVFYSHFHN